MRSSPAPSSGWWTSPSWSRLRSPTPTHVRSYGRSPTSRPPCGAWRRPSRARRRRRAASRRSPEAVLAAVAEEVGRLLEADLTVLARYEADDTATVVGLWSRLGDAVAVGSRGPLGGHKTPALGFQTARRRARGP